MNEEEQAAQAEAERLAAEAEAERLAAEATKPPTPEEFEAMIDARAQKLLDEREAASRRQAEAAKEDPRLQQIVDMANPYHESYNAVAAEKLRIEIAEERAVQRLAPSVRGLTNETAIKQMAGDDKHKSEFLKGYADRGADFTDPGVREVLQRAANDYAREKTPVTTTVRGDSSGSEPVQQLSQAVKAELSAALDIAEQALGYRPKVTDAQLLGAR